MNLAVAILIVVGAAAVGVAAMLLVRRHAPDGSYFQDGDRASGTGVQVVLEDGAPDTLLEVVRHTGHGGFPP